MGLVTRPGIEIAKTGTWSASTGKWTCTRSQLADAVRAASSGRFRNPVLKRGHVDPRFAGDAVVAGDGEPALGQLRNLRLAEGGDSLVADLLIPDWLDEELDAVYPSRSVEADLGVETADGERFELVVSGLALLGVTKPAIQSLAELPERVAASEYTAAMSIAAGFFDESAHPRGEAGTAKGGQFVAKGSGYKDEKDGQGKGDEADAVRDVQKELIRLGFLSADSGKNGGVDGLFGPKTEAAVKAWQKAQGDTPTGRVSPQLLATLKVAKPGDKGEARKIADGKAAKPGEKPAGKPAEKPKPGKTPEKPKKPYRPGKTTKVKMAADVVAAAAGLDVREISGDSVVFDDAQGRVWVSAWSGDDTITVATPAPAAVTYTPLAASAAALAAHALHTPVQWARGWESGQLSDSLGEHTVDITPQLREALGVDDQADETAILAAIEALKSPAVAPAPVSPAPTDAPISAAPTTAPDAAPEAPQAAVEALVAAALAPIQASHAAYEAKISELSGELAERKAREAVEHKTRILASAVADGKIAPAERATYEAAFDEAPAVTERILASIRPGTAVPVAALGYAGDDNADVGDEYSQFAAGFGWDGVPR